jgi:hypothetical protein
MPGVPFSHLIIVFAFEEDAADADHSLFHVTLILVQEERPKVPDESVNTIFPPLTDKKF